MGRPATGSPKWNASRGIWEARLTLANGDRLPVPMPGVPPCAATPKGSPSSCPCASCSQARRVALLMSQQARKEGRVPEGTAETADEWFVRYIAHAKASGQTDTVTKRSRWEKWISPRIGAKPMVDVTRDDVEDIRDALDAGIIAWKGDGKSNPDVLSGKTAMNVWSCLTSAFKAASSSKQRDLRALDGRPNPCTGVEPPGDRFSRKARRRPFVYPREADAVFACEAVPLEWRECHAVAAYLAPRPGELRVLTCSDVDLDARLVHVTKAWDYTDEVTKPPKTANGVRVIPIPAELLPLLERMMKGKAPGDLLLPCMSSVADNALAELFRQHLALAGVDRAALTTASRTHAIANFRTWRDSGLTWLAMTGLGVDKIMRRAGHDQVQTTMGYVKQAEDLTGDLGTPFGTLPEALVQGSQGSGLVSVYWSADSNDSATLWRRARDSNPWYPCRHT